MPDDLKKNQRYFFLGLAGLTLLYCLYYLYFIYVLAPELPLKARHLIKFFAIILAYVIGTFSLRKYTFEWMMQIWHWIYWIILAILLILGAYDWLIERTPLQVRIVADDLQDFLVSPILYVGIGLLNKAFSKQI
jgi:hypothetical protein